VKIKFHASEDLAASLFHKAGFEFIPVQVPFREDAGFGSAKEKIRLSRIEEMERKEVLAALEQNGWNQTRTAKEHGVTLRHIGYRIRKLGFEKMVEKHKRGIDVAIGSQGDGFHCVPPIATST
jgi:DNA-binding NtrC family response regulator